MGIRSTRNISRDFAIQRILEVNFLLEERDYRALEDIICEDGSVKYFIDNEQPLDINPDELERWTDTMLEDKIDEPFWRLSMFDNYLIR